MATVRNLAQGEYVIFHVRQHWRVLVVPALVLVAMVVGPALLIRVLPDSWHQTWLTWTIVGLAALVAVVFSVAPWVRWLCRTDTLTNYRLMSREGVITRKGRDIPMDRVHAVTYSKTLLERILGAGTLIVQTAAESSDVVLEDVAHVERRQLQIQEQLLGLDIPGIEADHSRQAPPPASTPPTAATTPLAAPPTVPLDGEPTQPA